ncbi:MAG: serpin family protein [Bacteroidales bacterium]|nr:serpin family protein [Bacteroidales bacterium]
MKKIFIKLSLIIPCLFFIFPSCDKLNLEKEREDILLTKGEQEITTNINKFAFDFFRNISINANKPNIFISPLSASLALSMTAIGAEGETGSQMKALLGFENCTTTEMNSYYKKISEELLNLDPKNTIAMANSIWIANGFNIKINFTSNALTYYNASVANVDFNNQNTLNRINDWCSDNTNNKIKKIFDELNPNLKLLLINALYFKGTWTQQFDKKNTYETTFHTLSGDSENVDMMYIESNFKYTSNDFFQIAELPYGNEAFSMVVLLPKENILFEDAVNQFTYNNWNMWMSSMDYTEISVHLPKFKLEYDIKLNNVLCSMGMIDAFNPMSANFSGISDSNLYIDLVKQNTYINVNEEGTEAAAVTSTGMFVTSMPESKIFKADRPFIYLIKEKSTGIILFIGQKG